jgi:Host cell surface-exposed lipoprotein
MSKKKGLAIGLSALTLIGVGASLAGGNDSASSAPAKAADKPAATEAPATTSTPAESPAPQAVEDELQAEQEANPEPTEPNLSVAQENAIETTASYLQTAGFSRTGLIDQLKYEGYKTKDATFAVDVIKVDWNQQAARVAKSYLDSGSFSRSGLIEQLQYEGFTPGQAEYGVQKAY